MLALKLTNEKAGRNRLVYSLFTFVRKEGRKCFYLTTHSTHFILRLYCLRHMVKEQSDSERGNLLPQHRLLFLLVSFIYMHLPTARITHTTAFVIPVVEYWLEQGYYIYGVCFVFVFVFCFLGWVCVCV